jgi:hypothetical protein
MSVMLKDTLGLMTQEVEKSKASAPVREKLSLVIEEKKKKTYMHKT